MLHFRASPYLGSPERLILGRMKKMNFDECEYAVGVFNEQKNRVNDFHQSLKKLNTCSFLLHDSMFFFVPNLLKIKREMQDFNPQLICTHDFKSNFYGLIISKIFRIPIVSTFHGRTKKDFKVKFYQMIDSLVLKYFDAIVCVSDETKKTLAKKGSYRNMYVIPNAVDIEEIKRLSKQGININFPTKKKQRRTVFFAGRLSKEKGLLYLIQAAEMILAKHDDVKFLILGEGPEEARLRRMISQKKIGNTFHLLGFKKNIYPYLKMADFLVLPSLAEGMPVIILEAFALGKSVIATDVGGISEIVQHNYNGLLCNPKDVIALVLAIEFLLLNSNLSSEMGENGFKITKENYNFEIQTKRYLSVYKKILTNKEKCQSKNMM